MAAGFVRSLHDKLVVDPVRRVVVQELENVSVRLAATVEETHRDLRRILGDLADANDQVAEAIGRTLTRLSAETEALHEEIRRLRGATVEPEPTS